LTPIAGSLIVCRIILMAVQTKFLFFLRLLAAAMGFGWSTYGKVTFSSGINKLF
jgi:protein YIPF6